MHDKFKGNVAKLQISELPSDCCKKLPARLAPKKKKKKNPKPKTVEI